VPSPLSLAKGDRDKVERRSNERRSSIEKCATIFAVALRRAQGDVRIAAKHVARMAEGHRSRFDELSVTSGAFTSLRALSAMPDRRVARVGTDALGPRGQLGCAEGVAADDAERDVVPVGF